MKVLGPPSPSAGRGARNADRKARASGLRSAFRVPRPALVWVRWGLTAALAVYLLFAHPCHGDEDTELLTRFWMGITGG